MQRLRSSETDLALGITLREADQLIGATGLHHLDARNRHASFGITVGEKPATVVVLLSQLGKVESEDLAAAVPGIDAVICGHNVPLLQKGRMVKNTVTSYGGEQGQYVSRTLITLDARGHMTTGENESFILGPEIPDKPEIATFYARFERLVNSGKFPQLDPYRNVPRGWW